MLMVVIEDDLMIADSAEDILAENEYQVCGIARTVMRSPCNHPMYDPGRLPDGFPLISTRRRGRGNERKTNPAAVARF